MSFWTSLRNTVESAVQVVATAVGGVVGGPQGAQVAAGITGTMGAKGTVLNPIAPTPNAPSQNAPNNVLTYTSPTSGDLAAVMAGNGQLAPYPAPAQGYAAPATTVIQQPQQAAISPAMTLIGGGLLAVLLLKRK